MGVEDGKPVCPVKPDPTLRIAEHHGPVPIAMLKLRTAALSQVYMTDAHYIVVADPHFIVIQRHNAGYGLSAQSILRRDGLPFLTVEAIQRSRARCPQHTAGSE